MYMGMSALVCSLIWTYLRSGNKRVSVYACAWEPQTLSNSGGREQAVSSSLSGTVSLVTTFLHLHVVHSLPPCLRSPRHHHGNPKSHISSSFLNRPGGIVRSHAVAQTSVWRWFCNKALPLTRTQRWAKSSPQAVCVHMALKHCTLTLTQYRAKQQLTCLVYFSLL